MSNNISRLNDEKKKILVYTSFFFPWANANTNVLMPIIDYLSKYYTVDIVTEKHSKNDPSNDVYKGYKVYRYDHDKPLFSILLTLTEKDPFSAVTPFIRAKFALIKLLHFKPITAMIRCIAKKNSSIVSSKAVNKIKELLLSNSYSAILSVSAPIEPQYVVLVLAKEGVLDSANTKWFPFFTDPHATFIGNSVPQKERLLLQEYEIYKLADLVFTPPELYEDN